MNNDICVNHAQSLMQILRDIIYNTLSSSKDIQYLHCTLFPFAFGEQLEFQCFWYNHPVYFLGPSL